VTDGSSGALGPATGFTPIVDGRYIQDHLPLLLASGKYNRRVKRVIASNMENEGMYMSPSDGMPETFPPLVRETAPGASDETIARIQSMYDYPPGLPEKLAWDWATDISFACNAYSIAKAYSNKAQRNVMTIPPATHGQDINCKCSRLLLKTNLPRIC
jgi:carboxylesterase type B